MFMTSESKAQRLRVPCWSLCPLPYAISPNANSTGSTDANMHNEAWGRGDSSNFHTMRLPFKLVLSAFEATAYGNRNGDQHVTTSLHTVDLLITRSYCGSVDKTTVSPSWGPRFESAGSGSSALGQGTLSSLHNPSKRT